MTYDRIFSSFYPLIDDPDFFKKSSDDAYELMTEWLHKAIANTYIRKLFSRISLDDEIMELDYELINSDGGESDDDFVISVLSQFMVIQWLRPKVDRQVNLVRIIGGKEEKNLQSNYKTNIERLDSLELQLRKYIRDRGTEFNSYLNGGE